MSDIPPGGRTLACACTRPLPFAAWTLALLAGVALLHSPGSRADTGTDGRLTRLVPDDLAVVARGETVYRTTCASCHGGTLEGQPDWRQRDASGLLPAPPHDATGHTWHHADDLLFEIVKFGAGAVIGDPDYRSAMPPYEHTLSDDDIVAVLSYIVNSWPDQERAYQSEIDQGQAGSPRPGEKAFALDGLFK